MAIPTQFKCLSIDSFTAEKILFSALEKSEDHLVLPQSSRAERYVIDLHGGAAVVLLPYNIRNPVQS